MRITDIVEKRKNPELNPKISINQSIKTYLNDVNEAGLDDDKAFISFTFIEKLGINPKSNYKTPIGIYAYPLKYAAQLMGDTKTGERLPFAGESPYANLFIANGNIVDVSNMSNGDVNLYYHRLRKLYSNLVSKFDKHQLDMWDNVVQDETTIPPMTFDDLIEISRKNARLSDVPGGRFWYVVKILAEMLGGKENSHVKWNSIFRAIGIDGCVDYDGYGIIHPNEPTQAVFFKTDVIKNKKRVDNKYSPDSIVNAYKTIGHDLTKSKQFVSKLTSEQVHDIAYEYPTILRQLRGRQNTAKFIAPIINQTHTLLQYIVPAKLGTEEYQKLLLNVIDNTNSYEYILDMLFNYAKSNSVSSVVLTNAMKKFPKVYSKITYTYPKIKDQVAKEYMADLLHKPELANATDEQILSNMTDYYLNNNPNFKDEDKARAKSLFMEEEPSTIMLLILKNIVKQL